MKAPILAVAVIVLLLTISNTVFRLTEVQQAIITQFGNPVGEALTEPGLHLKMPFIQEVHRFDKRWLEWDGVEVEMPTKEKTYIYVDTFARWRIVDPLKFYTSVRNEDGAQTRLDAIIDSETRNVIATFELLEVVRSSNRAFVKVEQSDDANRSAGMNRKKLDIEVGRDKLTRLILDAAAKEMPNYGIELVDIQFQRVNYTETVKRKVFDRMISERKSIAASYRSEGEGLSARIRGDKERELKTIESEAYREVQSLKGEADAQATSIYASAYNRDPNLYRLLKSLESYEKTIDEDSLILLSSESDYYGALVDSSRK